MNNYTPSTESDRLMEQDLRNSIRTNAWRAAMGLPLRPDPLLKAQWLRTVYQRFWLAYYRRRHPMRTA